MEIIRRTTEHEEGEWEWNFQKRERKIYLDLFALPQKYIFAS